MDNLPRHEVGPNVDMSRPDVAVDLRWWTTKLMEQLAQSEYGGFEEELALQNICTKYNVSLPKDSDTVWEIFGRAGEVATYDEYDFIGGEYSKILTDMTKYDE